MRRLILLLFPFLLFYNSYIYGQTSDKLMLLFSEGLYEQVYNEGQRLLQHNPDDAETLLLTGEAYAELGKYDSSITFLKKAIVMDSDADLTTRWSYYYLSYVYYCKGDMDKAEKNSQMCIKVNATDHTIKAVQFMTSIINLARYHEIRRTIEGEKIRYHFIDTNRVNVQQFVKRHEAIYKYVNGKLPITLPRKIDLYVWADSEKAGKFLNRPLSFSLPRVFMCNSYIKETTSPELTEILTYWSYGRPTEVKTKFISEGLSLYLDEMKPEDKESQFRDACDELKSSGFSTVIDMWEVADKYPDDILSAVAGKFVQFMFDHSSSEQFEELIKNQTIEDAKRIYGVKFDTLIGEFNKMILQ